LARNNVIASSVFRTDNLFYAQNFEWESYTWIGNDGNGGSGIRNPMEVTLHGVNFFKVIYARFGHNSHYLGWLTKLHNQLIVADFIITFEQLAKHTKGLIDYFYKEHFIRSLKEEIRA